MSHRGNDKLPANGLFYFETDQTISIVPLKKISSVISGDKTTKGSIVELYFNNVLLQAEIIAVNDDTKILRDLEIEFLQDKQNAHLFSRHDAIVFAEKNKQQEKTVKKRGRPRKTDEKEYQPKAKKRSVTKDQVTLATPSTPTITCSVQPSTSPASVDTAGTFMAQASLSTQSLLTPTLASSLQQPDFSSLPSISSLPSLSIPTLANSLQQPVFSSLPSISTLSLPAVASVEEKITKHVIEKVQGGLLQQILPILGRLEYKIDILMSSVGVPQAFTNASHYRQVHAPSVPTIESGTVMQPTRNAKPAHTVPGTTPQPEVTTKQYQVGSVPLGVASSQHEATPTQAMRTHNIQQEATSLQKGEASVTTIIPVQSELDVTHAQTLVKPSHSPSAQPEVATSVAVEVPFQTSVQQYTASTPQIHWNSTIQQCTPTPTVSVVVTEQLEATPASLVETVSAALTTPKLYAVPTSLSYPSRAVTRTPEETYSIIHKQASSSANFTVRLMREMFKPAELYGRNVAGLRGKLPLDPARANKIKELLFSYYPGPVEERQLLWSYCRKAMDSYLRKLKDKSASETNNAGQALP